MALGKTRLRLAAGTHDHVHADKRVRHQAADPLHAAAKERRVVASAHQLEDGVAAALQRDMEVRHEAAAGGYELDDLIRDEVRLDGGNTVARNALDPIQRAEEIQKSLARGAPEVANIDAGEDDLPPAFARHPLGLRYEVGNAAIPTASARKRDGTERTEIVTAVLHLQKVARAIVRRAGGGESANAFRVGRHRQAGRPLAQVTHHISLLLSA